MIPQFYHTWARIKSFENVSVTMSWLCLNFIDAPNCFGSGTLSLSLECLGRSGTFRAITCLLGRDFPERRSFLSTRDWGLASERPVGALLELTSFTVFPGAGPEFLLHVGSESLGILCINSAAHKFPVHGGQQSTCFPSSRLGFHHGSYSEPSQLRS